MFCWPSRRNTKSRRKSKSSDFSSTGDDDLVSVGSGILVKPHRPHNKKGKKSGATFKCDLSEALLTPSDECLLNSRPASCNSSIRDLHGYHHHYRGVGGGRNNKEFVSSSQHLPNFPTIPGKDEDSVSVNNHTNRSAEVLLFYSNNSISTRNSLADFIENEEFNYKSLWGKDISEWDSRESKNNTLERGESQTYYVKTGGSASKRNNKNSDKKTDKSIVSGSIIEPNESKIEENRSKASSSPSLSISVNNFSKSFTSSNGFAKHDEDPLPSPPPTPPEAKLSISLEKSSLETFFKYPSSEESEEKLHRDRPNRIHSSTSTSSLSSSCILTPEIIEKPLTLALSPTLIENLNFKGTDCETQTLPFWQLEFPGIICTCSHSCDDNAIGLNSGVTSHLESSTPSSSTRNSSEGGVGIIPTPTPSSSILCTRGHESPGGDSTSSGISSSDDNLESLHADEEIMLKSLKNSFLHQALPFQLCSFGGNNRHGSGGSRCTCCKGKPVISNGNSGAGAPLLVGDSVITSIANNNSSVHSIINNEFANSVVAVTNNLIEKQKVQEENYKNQQQNEQLKGKCESFEESISVTNQQDRNRLGPVGKNYGAPGLDANANESADGNNRGQSNGEIGKSNTKTADGGVAEPLIDSTNHGKKSVKNRVSAANQQNIQNSLLVQENSSLKEEVNRLSSVVADLQQQIAQLASSEEETRKTLEGRLVKADLSCTALSIVAQQVDQEKNRLTDELSKERAQRKEWKLRLDEKLIELQNLQDEYEQEREYHQEELRTLSSNHEIEVDVTVRNCENKLAQMQKRHDETLAELKRSHNDELERLQESQRQELKETVQKHRELLDQHRNQSPHDILHKEVESLQAVLEMRNEEIRVLRKDLMDYKNTLNDLQMAREHGKSLQAKIEDLEAQLEKARADKRSLQERYQMLDARRQQLESESSRLARCNDELTYKLKSCNFVEN